MEDAVIRKQRETYTSPLDALVAVSKQLSLYENQRGMDSETFFDRYQKGLVGDDAESVEWANDYQYFVVLYLQLQRMTSNPSDMASQEWNGFSERFGAFADQNPTL